MINNKKNKPIGPSHLSDIGFRTDDDCEDLIKIFEDNINDAITFSYEKKKGVVLKLDNAEFWFSANIDSPINPFDFGLFYNTENYRKFRDPEIKKINSDTSAILNVWSEENDLTFNVEIPNVMIVKKHTLKADTIYKCQMACFAAYVQVYENEDIFHKEHDRMNIYSFIPIGQFSEEETSEVLINGIVKSINRKTNSYTNQAFSHLVVETFGMEFDVLIEECFLPKIKIGNIISTSGWMSGKLYF